MAESLNRPLPLVIFRPGSLQCESWDTRGKGDTVCRLFGWRYNGAREWKRRAAGGRRRRGVTPWWLFPSSWAPSERYMCVCGSASNIFFFCVCASVSSLLSIFSFYSLPSRRTNEDWDDATITATTEKQQTWETKEEEGRKMKSFCELGGGYFLSDFLHYIYVLFAWAVFFFFFRREAFSLPSFWVDSM